MGEFKKVLAHAKELNLLNLVNLLNYNNIQKEDIVSISKVEGEWVAIFYIPEYKE